MGGHSRGSDRGNSRRAVRLSRRGLAFGFVVAVALVAACSPSDSAESESAETAEPTAAVETDAPFQTMNESVDHLIDDRETHFGSLRMLTNGGQNAEAYFSADDERLMFQATPRGASCDQQFTMRIDGSDLRLVSTGTGRTTCGYYFPAGDGIVYSSTHLGGEACPPDPDFSQGYVWALYPDFEVFTANADGSGLTRITDEPGYDAEATVSRDGEWIVFTSVRDGDLDIYKMRRDGSDVQRLTDEIGYDGGPFFSYDGSKIVYRAGHPTGADEIADYQRLLAQGLIRPSQLDIFVMDADGSNKRQLTDNGAANFGPYFFPDGERIIFSSNLGDESGREFDLWMINVDGSGLQQVTFTGDFDGFPMFNSDGSKLVFASNRGNDQPRETNLFIADWVD